MRFIEPLTEHEMVAHFLRHEIDSERFGSSILVLLNQDGKTRSIVDQPDIRNADENDYRTKLLGDFRGYKRDAGVFTGFPKHVAWGRYGLTKRELERVRYIDYSYWNELTNGSRLPTVAAISIRAGATVFGQSTEPFLSAAHALESGALIPELILVGTDQSSYLVVLEGHARLTSYFLVPDLIPKELVAVVGFSTDMSSWM